MKTGDIFSTLGHRFAFIEFVGDKRMRAENLVTGLISVIRTPRNLALAQLEAKAKGNAKRQRKAREVMNESSESEVERFTESIPELRRLRDYCYGHRQILG